MDKDDNEPSLEKVKDSIRKGVLSTENTNPTIHSFAIFMGSNDDDDGGEGVNHDWQNKGHPNFGQGFQRFKR